MGLYWGYDAPFVSDHVRLGGCTSVPGVKLCILVLGRLTDGRFA